MTTKRLLCLSVVASTMAVAPVARAAAPALEHGTMMISAERLFGLSVGRTTTDINNGRVSRDQTHFGLFLAPSSPISHVFLIPRLAFDVAVIDGLTLGGSLGFVISDYGTSTTVGGNTVDQSEPSVTTFLIAPRVGYSLGISRVVSLWLRGGISYWSASSQADPGVFGGNVTRVSAWGLSVDLEPTLVISPFEHVGFTAGLAIDLPAAGKASTERMNGAVTTTTSVDTRVRNFGIMAGMLVSF
jgi:hypothetical protein